VKILPTLDKLFPFLVGRQVVAKTVLGGCTGLKRRTSQAHIRVFWHLATFTPVAGRAGCHYVGPRMGSIQSPRSYVINGQNMGFSATILACKLIPTQYFSLGQADLKARPLDHIF